jgi:polyhydroxybutyrate depolymerase
MLVSILISTALLLPQPSVQQREWTVDGVRRTAAVYVPMTSAGEKPPLVFVFHGHGGSTLNAIRSMPLHRHMPQAVVVFPQGLPTVGALTDPEGTRSGWQANAGDNGNRDLKFFDAMLATMKREFHIDENRVYSTGHSNGGGFTILLWAERHKDLAAVAPCASAGFRQLPALKPLPVMHIAGENDPLVRFAWQQRMMNAVKRVNGCASEAKPWGKNGELVGVEYPSAKGTPLVAVIHSGTHKYPADAPALIAMFFQQHRRAEAAPTETAKPLRL